MRLIFDGGGNWSSTYIWLTQHPHVRHFQKGEIVEVDYPAGSQEAVQIQQHIDRGACRIVGDSRPMRKPAA